jgi:hypothetical protein
MKPLAFNLFAMAVMFFAYFTGTTDKTPFWPKWVDACLFISCALSVLWCAYDLKHPEEQVK